MTGRLVVSCCSGRNYQALTRLCGYIDALDRYVDAYGGYGMWTMRVCKLVTNILFIQIIEVGQIRNPFKFDSEKCCRSHSTYAHKYEEELNVWTVEGIGINGHV